MPWSLLFERANVEAASLVHFATNAEKEKAKLCGWHFRRTIVIPTMLDLSEWKELPPRAQFESMFPKTIGREIVLFVGRINWVKNLDILITAIKTVCRVRPSAMLVCVGPDSDGHQAKLEKLASSLRINKSILFTGMLTGDNLKAAYARGDAFALVSKKENFGLSAAEALACGLPVVLSQGVDLARDLPIGGPISSVPAEPNEIAKALIQMLEWSKAHGLPDLQARKISEQQWPNSLVDQYIDAYSKI